MLDKKTHYIIFHDMCSFGQTGTQKADPVIGGKKEGKVHGDDPEIVLDHIQKSICASLIANIVIYYSLIFQDFLKMVFR